MPRHLEEDFNTVKLRFMYFYGELDNKQFYVILHKTSKMHMCNLNLGIEDRRI